ncbi:PTS transporter subunit EIIC [Paenibacillus rhizophilus]|uniref:PTS sucrose transporter subunit IIBC n=1 Tax=Paenibacillus rhizophilus TaxID=1850366 RepID=A0A3N9Q6D1_9BACL|nr:PTS transporter subunit EIIC [Paenibacillus rhizophilus]RQW13056.1 PTS sucrose transporter subunit IIBC [Paenibacillus rhizophilus]
MPHGNTRQTLEGRNVGDSRGSAKKLAMSLIELSGGPDNVSEVTHCTTRIRMRLRNSASVDETGLAHLEEVQNVFVQAGQLQIIVGPAIVFKVHRQIARILQDYEPDRQPEAERLFTATDSSPELQGSATKGRIGRFLAAAAFFSDIVVPIIPLFIAVGMLLGLISLIEAFDWAPLDSVWFQTLLFLTGSAFQIIAVMFGYQSAKRFGGTPALGAAVGIVMTRPDLVQLAGQGGTVLSHAALSNAPQFVYQGTVIPIILAVLLMTLIEKGLRRIIPGTAAVILVPFLTFVIGGGIAVAVIGPIATELGGFLSGLLEQAFQFGSTVFGLLLGGVYGLLVLSGLHHGIQAIEIGLISNPDIGVNFLLPIWSMANIAQGGAGLAVYARTQDDALKKIALPASITAFLGISEPIAFGVNLKLGRPFLGAAAGGAAGGAYVAFHGVVADSFGLTGIPMIAFIVPPGHINLIHYIIGFLLATGTAFAVTWFLGVDKPNKPDKLDSQE